MSSIESMKWLAGIGIAALPVLNPSPVQALAFSFSFSNPGQPPITGVISGLADTADSQKGPPVRVAITGGPAEAIGVYTFSDEVNNRFGEPGNTGFSTSDGAIVLKDPTVSCPSTRDCVSENSTFIWTGLIPWAPSRSRFLRFGRPPFEVESPVPFGFITGAWAPDVLSRGTPMVEGMVTGPVLFQVVEDPVVAEVPGPFPLLGAAAAFGISRRLRQRIRSAGSSVPAPASKH